MKILFVPRGSRQTASSRYRVYDIAPYLEEKGHDVVILNKADYYLQQSGVHRGIGILRYLVDLLYHLSNSDVVFIQKFILPELIRSLLNRISTPIIYDFDDPLFAKPPHGEDGNSNEAGLQEMFELSDAVTTGSKPLKEYAEQYHSAVHLLPPSLSADRYSYKSDEQINSESEELVIGWIGNPQNLEYLDLIKEALREILENNPDTVLAIISSRPYEIEEYEDQIRFHRWSKESEIEDLKSFDIAIRPLGADEYSQKKGGLVSVLQCMALGIPVVVTPAECSYEIINDGKTGLFASSNDEWIEQLQRLIDSAELRKDLGDNAREMIEDKYFRSRRAKEYLTILKSVAEN